MKNNFIYFLFRFHFLLMIFSILFTKHIKAQETNLEVRKIWDAAPHNAFTDLIRFDGKFYCTFREGTGHVPGENGADGKIRIIASDDGKQWESVALLEKENTICVMPSCLLHPKAN